MKRRIAILTLALLLCGCAGKPSAPSADPIPPDQGIAGITVENYPNLDGSTATMPLLAGLYARAHQIDRSEAEALISVDGTAGAWRQLYHQGADLLVVYEAPESVKQEISRVDFEITPLGRDALVFLVSQNNPVDNLTSEQLRQIYEGNLSDWSEVGGTPGPIQAFQRNAESGSQTMFLKLLMKERTPMEPPKGLVAAEMGALIEGVAAFDGEGASLGYSVYYYAQEMIGNPDIKFLSVDGVKPSPETIASGAYPLTNDFVTAIRADQPENSPARILRDWLLSDEGRQLLIEEGYIPARQTP